MWCRKGNRAQPRKDDTMDILDLADSINRHHKTFAGHLTSPSSARVYDSLMRIHDYLVNEPAAKSVNYDAELEFYDNDGFQVRPTTITVWLTENPEKYELYYKEYWKEEA